MYLQTWAQVLQQSFQNLLWGVVNFIPNFIFAVIVFLIGWFIAVWVEMVIEQIVKAIRVDHALRATGAGAVVERAGYNLNSGRFLGVLVKWFIIIAVFIACLEILDLSAVAFFIQQIVLSFLPQVIIAVLVLLVAAVVAEVAQGVVAGGARAAGIRGAGFAGTVAKWAIWIFAIIVALSQLGIAAAYFQTLFTGIVVALSLAVGLAFGLGGQDAAARFLEHTRSDIKGK